MTRRINVRPFAGAPAGVPANAHNGPAGRAGGPSAHAGETVDHLRKHRPGPTRTAVTQRRGDRHPQMAADAGNRAFPGGFPPLEAIMDDLRGDQKSH